jgi:putative SOS response-associated peptidase YedK
MCGRIALYTEPERLARRFDGAMSKNLGDAENPRWNVAPTQTVLTLVHPSLKRIEAAGGELEMSDSGRLLEPMRWGLVPWWAKDLSIGNKMFNARAETLETKGAFKSALESHRCLVLADGFYEWKRNDGAGRRRRTPSYFTRSDGEPMAFAGLWSSWRDPKLPKDASPRIQSCTIVTTSSNADVEAVHDRMPVIVECNDVEEWLEPSPLDSAELATILRPSPAGTLTSIQVSTSVNSVEHDGPELIDPVSRDYVESPAEQTLF